MAIMDEVKELAHYATEVVANPQAAIAIRDEHSTYLYVNDRWEQISGASRKNVIGKRLDEVLVVPVEQAERFIREDKQTIRQLRLVSVDVYHVQTVPVRFMTVRTFLPKNAHGFLVEVSFILGPVITSVMLGWSSERLERAFGEDLASSLLKGRI